MLHNQGRRVNAAIPDGHIIVAGVGLEQVPHGIPIGNDEPQDREGERPMQQHSAQRLGRTNTATTSALSRRRHHSGGSSSLALFTDTIEVFREMKKLTSKVGCLVVTQLAIAVNKRVTRAHERQKYLLNNKRRKLNPEVPDKAPSSTTAVGSDHDDDELAIDTSDIEKDSHANNDDEDDKENDVVDVAAEKAAAEKAAVVSDEERWSILRQAARMKRMSVIVCDLDLLHGMLIRELQYCRVEQQANALYNNFHTHR
jgi:hypothetical protein